MKQKQTEIGKKKQAIKAKSTPKIAIKPPKNFPIWLAAFIFVVTTVIFFWDQLLANSFFWEDFVEQVYPIQTFAARAAANWFIPFWNPYSFAGMPFFADLQVGFFYPFNRLLSFFLDSGGNLPVRALEFIIILHFFISQFSMFMLMRYWKVSFFGSLISAVSYGLSLSLVCHTIHPMIVYQLAWFPLVIMFFIKAYERVRIRCAIVSGLIFGMSMLAGHPQTMLYESLFLLFLLLWYIIADIKKYGKEGAFIQSIAKITNLFSKKKETEINNAIFHKYLAIVLLPFIIAVGIFAVQYLPSQELANLSKRADQSFEKASEGSLELKQIYTAVVPKIFGSMEGAGDSKVPFHLKSGEKRAPYYFYWDTAFYFGIAALLLGLFGAVIKIRTREGAFLVAVSIFGFLFALGSNFFIFEIFYNLPFFGLLRIPARIMFFAGIALSALSGFGFDTLWEKRKNPQILKRLIIVSSVLLFISLLVALGAIPSILDTPEQFQSTVQGFGAGALFYILAIFTISLMINRSILMPEIGGIIIFILAFIDLYGTGASFNQGSNNPEISFMKSYERSPRLKTLFTPHPPKDIYRVNMRYYNPTYMAMFRNQGMIDKIMLLEGYNQLVLDRAVPPAPDKKTIHDLLNVKYEIGIDSIRKVFSFFTRYNYFPRAWLVYNAIVTMHDKVENLMKSGGIDYRNTVILEEKPSVKLSESQAVNLTESIKCLEYKDNHFKYKVNTPQPAIVCFSEIYYPEWKAYIDDKPTKILRGNYCLRAVAVPAGNHTIEMRYEDAKFNKGLIISLFTLLASVIVLVVANMRKVRASD